MVRFTPEYYPGEYNECFPEWLVVDHVDGSIVWRSYDPVNGEDDAHIMAYAMNHPEEVELTGYNH